MYINKHSYHLGNSLKICAISAFSLEHKSILHCVLFFSRPEALGVVSGCVFLVTCFLFIPIVFGNSLMDTAHFPHNEVKKSRFHKHFTYLNYILRFLIICVYFEATEI